MSSESELQCWLSLDHRNGRQFFNNITFSFIAEPEVRRRYAGIELLLIQRGIAADLLLETSTSQAVGRSGISHDSVKYSHRVPEKARSKQSKRFLKVAFLVKVSPYLSDIHRSGSDNKYCTLKPLTGTLDQELSQVIPSHQASTQKCYIGTLAKELYLWPACSGSQECPPPLEISYGIVYFPRRRSTSWSWESLPARKEVICVRVLPCRDRSPTSSSALSREILLKIGRYLREPKDIASASAVRKSWRPMISTFLSRLGYQQGICILPLSRFATAVQLNASDWRFFITGLDLRDFDLERTPRFYVRDIGEIIGHLPNLIVLRLNLFVVTWAAAQLSALELVEEFACDSYAMEGQDASRLASLSRVQEIISGWHNLSNLTLSGVGRTKWSPESVAPQSPTYQLQNLTYDNDKISDDQFLHILSCPDQAARLQCLDLENIEGILPSAFATFLDAVSSTLVELRLINCDKIVIEPELGGRSSTPVLKTLLPRMKTLSHLDLRGRVVDHYVFSWSPQTTVGATELKLYVETRELRTEQGLDVGMNLEYAHIRSTGVMVIILNDTALF